MAGASVLSGGINALQSRSNTNRTIRGNMELAKYSYGRDLEMWEKQNAYNSPSNQMAMLKAAGLNPNLVYGGSNPVVASAPAPKFNPPTVEYRNLPVVDPGSAYSAYQDTRLRQAQIDNVQAQTANTDARTINESIRQSINQTMSKTKIFDLDTKEMMRPYNVQIGEAKVRQSRINLEATLQRMKVMRQDEILKSIESRYKEKKVSQMDIQKEILQAEAIFRRYRAEFIKAGITTSDNPILRMFVRGWNETGAKINKDAVQSVLRVGSYDQKMK